MISQEILDQLLAFRRERDWEQFHNLRTLSTSIVLEAAELAEITQWVPDSGVVATSIEKRARIEEEVADITILLSYLVHDLEIDLDLAVQRKLRLNAEKYPVARSKGSARKYDEFD